MKYIINTTYGGFTIPTEVMDYLNLHSHFETNEDIRTDPYFIDWIQNNRAKLALKGRTAELAVVEIPDNATDWRLEEYDGLESIIAVIDGKLVDIYG